MAGDPTVKVIYIESPANPTNILSDIPAARELAGPVLHRRTGASW